MVHHIDALMVTNDQFPLIKHRCPGQGWRLVQCRAPIAAKNALLAWQGNTRLVHHMMMQGHDHWFILRKGKDVVGTVAHVENFRSGQ